LLGAIAVFIKDALPVSVRIPNVFYPSINTFQQTYQSGNEMVRLIAQVFEKDFAVFVWGRGEKCAEQAGP